jgi:hypothetical protein
MNCPPSSRATVVSEVSEICAILLQMGRKIPLGNIAFVAR